MAKHLKTKHLKPCPFCGSELILEKEILYYPGKNKESWFPLCVNEECPMSNPANYGEQGGVQVSWEKEKAVEITNSRLLEDDLRVQLAERDIEIARMYWNANHEEP